MYPEIVFDEAVDARGMSCPYPILQTKKAVKSLAPNQVLRLETTDPASKNDVAAWVRNTGNELVGIAEHSGVFTFYIRKTR
jgi:TusA-related sulfurtransferase